MTKKCCGLIVGPIGFKLIGSDKHFNYFNCPKCKSTRVLKHSTKGTKND